MDLGSGDSYAASYDTGMRLTSASLTQVSTSTLLSQTQPAYDAANNVVSVQTSVSGATDTQQFCYDNLDRLTWAATSGTPPCTGTNFSAGTLTAAQYQQSDSYTVDGGLSSGSNGSYTYGDSTHPHAVTATSGGYSAAYDAAGNLVCRAPTSATTCTGTPTGQQLGYDAEGRVSSWQNQPGSPTQTANNLYDGDGNRVAMQTTTGGTTSTTAYINDIEEVQSTGGTTQTTTYYMVAGQRIAATVNGTWYYFGYDALGSQIVVLNNSGALVGLHLYGPYGDARYSTGTLPTSIGFTGQHTDAVTGLDYYNARYYDPVAGVFVSPDWVQGNILGMDPYTYVSANPETLVDPSGLCDWWNILCKGLQAAAGAVGAIATWGEDAVGVGLGWFGDAVGPLLPWVGPLLLIGMLAHAIWNQFAYPPVLACGCVTHTPAKPASKPITATALSLVPHVTAHVHQKTPPVTQKSTAKARKVLNKLKTEKPDDVAARSTGTLSNGDTVDCNSTAN